MSPRFINSLIKNPSESEKLSDGFFINLSLFWSLYSFTIKNALTIACKCASLLVIPGRFELPTYRLGVLTILKLTFLCVIFLHFMQNFAV